MFHVNPPGGDKDLGERPHNGRSRRGESGSRDPHSKVNSAPEHHLVVRDHRDAQTTLPDHGVRQWRGAIRLHCRQHETQGG